MKNNLSKLLIIGAYPENKIYGGIVTDCKKLRNSNIYKNFDVEEFDSSQKSNPPPGFFTRLIHASIRFMSLTKKLLLNKYDVLIIFFSNGAGAFEKLIYSRIFQSRTRKIIMLPRAGALKNELHSFSWIFKRLIKHSLDKKISWFVQGSDLKDALQKGPYLQKSVEIVNPWAFEFSQRLDYVSESSKVHIIYVGWLEPLKGVKDLMNIIKFTNGNHKYSIIGNGSLENEVHDFAIENDNVEFLGWKTPDDLSKLYQQSHILVLPSYTEGLPNVIVEAMCNGLAIVSTDVGEISDIVDHDDLFVPGESQRIADRINNLISDKTLLKNKMVSSHNYAKRNFGIDSINLKLKDLLY